MIGFDVVEHDQRPPPEYRIKIPMLEIDGEWLFTKPESGRCRNPLPGRSPRV